MYRPSLKVLLSATVLLWVSIAFFNTGIFVFSTDEEIQSYHFFSAFRWTLLYHSPWLLIIPCILYLGRKFPLHEGVMAKHLSLHFFTALLITFIGAIAHTYFIYIRLEAEFELSSVPGNFLFYAVDRLLIYFAVLLGYYAIDYYRKQNEESLRELKLEESINRQKFNNFKNDIHPDFLINTLRDIEGLVPSGPETAEKMIADLAQMIRKMLQNSKKESISADDDLHFLKSYITILEIRIGKNIHFREDDKTVDKNSDIAISHFVISIVEELLNRDKDILRSFDNLLYKLFESDQAYGVQVQIEKLPLSGQDLEKWFGGISNKIMKPFTENHCGNGEAKISYAGDGTLYLSMNMPKTFL